ncbi:unnamed protein product [Rhizoctonia solani]|uniref:Extracellular membrane protein CFEM domain-containing protein n=1 Tax=Rhizoctonia solani TaxID=456999 RepID=A0A8H3BX80_9AGAM|nr:unnamed protein product [Rhizoctonia solani]
MRAFTIISALIAVAISGVVATPATPAPPAGGIPALIARQAGSPIPDIPAECQAKCATVQKITTCGTDLACMCTNAMGQGIVDCGNCGIEYHKSDPNINSYKASFQASVNSYADSCTQAGHPVGPFSVTGSSNSGGNSGGSGTSASSTGKSTGTATAASGSVPTGMITSGGTNGAVSFRAAAGTGAFAAVAAVMVAVL